MLGKKLTAIVCIPVIVGIGLLIAGIVAKLQLCVYIGIGVLFGGSFLVALIVTVIVIVKAAKGESTVSEMLVDKDAKNAGNVAAEDDEDSEYDDYEDVDETDEYDDDEDYGDDETKPRDERADEEERIEKINSTYGYANDAANADHQISHIKNAYRNSSRGAKIGGVLFVVSFIACLVAGMVLMTVGYTLIGGIVFGCGAAIIIVSLIVVKIKERTSLSSAYDPADYTRKSGTVKACYMSSSSSVNDRLKSVTYKVLLDVEGNTLTAYSHEYYNTDEILNVLVHKNGKRAKIADEYEPVTKREERTAERDLEERDKRLRTFEKEVEDRREFYAAQSLRESEENDDKTTVESEDAEAAERDAAIDKTGIGENAPTDVDNDPVLEAESVPDMPSVLPNVEDQKMPAVAHEPVKAPAPKRPTPNVGYKGIKKK